MKCTRVMLTGLCTLSILMAVGCANRYAPPPPPPPPYAQVPPLLQLAERNGFETGRQDGLRDANNGIRYSARRTPAFHDTPGYEPQLGPYGDYRRAFRNAYLRGYDWGYYRRH